MKPSLKFVMKIPWNYTQDPCKNLIYLITILVCIISQYNVTLQGIPLNNKNVNKKRSVDLTTAVIQKDKIDDDAYSKLATSCPSLDRKIYVGHSPMGFLAGELNSSKINYQKVSSKSVSTLDDCMDECCNKRSSCESIFAYVNNSVSESRLTCFMITCKEGKYCLPSESTKKLENSTAVILLRPPSGVSVCMYPYF